MKNAPDVRNKSPKPGKARLSLGLAGLVGLVGLAISPTQEMALAPTPAEPSFLLLVLTQPHTQTHKKQDVRRAFKTRAGRAQSIQNKTGTCQSINDTSAVLLLRYLDDVRDTLQVLTQPHTL